MSPIPIVAPQKIVPVDHRHCIMDMDISVISSWHHLINININNIDTMGPIISMTVIPLARGQRHPSNIP
jgi:hypothetical protein